MLIGSLEEAVILKQQNEKFVGKIVNPEITPLLRLIIIQITPEEVGKLWANQREASEDDDSSKSISDEEFEKQLKEFDHIDLSKKDGYFYVVIGLFRSKNGEPRFQPIQSLSLKNSNPSV